MNHELGHSLRIPGTSRLIALGGLVLLLVGCGSAASAGGSPSATGAVPGAGAATPGSAWSVAEYRGDAARTGAMPGPAPSGTPVVAWTFKAGAPIGSSPAVVADDVYALGNDGVVHAVTLAKGEERWHASLGADASASPLISDGLLIVGDSSGVVHALAIADGATRWTLSTDGPISGAAAASAGVVVVGSKGGTAYGIDPATGTRRWATPLGGPIGSSVAIADGTAYLGAGPNLTAVALSDGSVRWKQSISSDGRIGTPTAADGMVFAATGLDSDDPSLYGVSAVDAATGALRWRFTSPTQAVVYTPAVVDGRAYIVGEDHRVVAVDATSGKVLWSTTTNDVDESVPAMADGLVFVAGNGGEMAALDATTGAIRWTVPYRGVPYGPTVVGGYVLVGTDLGNLVAIGGSAK